MTKAGDGCVDSSFVKKLSPDAQYEMATKAARSLIAGLIDLSACQQAIHGGVLAALTESGANIIGFSETAKWLRGAADHIEREGSMRAPRSVN